MHPDHRGFKTILPREAGDSACTSMSPRLISISSSSFERHRHGRKRLGELSVEGDDGFHPGLLAGRKRHDHIAPCESRRWRPVPQIHESSHLAGSHSAPGSASRLDSWSGGRPAPSQDAQAASGLDTTAFARCARPRCRLRARSPECTAHLQYQAAGQARGISSQARKTSSLISTRSILLIATTTLGMPSSEAM